MGTETDTYLLVDRLYESLYNFGKMDAEEENPEGKTLEDSKGLTTTTATI